MSGPLRRGWQLVWATLAVVLLGVWALAGSSLGGFGARVVNPGNNAAAATTAFTHRYGSTSCHLDGPGTADCPGSFLPSQVPVTGTSSSTDALRNDGTATATSLHQQVRAEGCGPAALRNLLAPADPMLVRYGTTFGPNGRRGPGNATPMPGAGAITLDGSTGYTASVSAQTLNGSGLLDLGTKYGVGIWFATTSTAGGPLFGFGASPTNGSGTADRILYMNKTGHLGFGYNTGGSATGLSSTAYNDGNWHFAYVTMTVTGLIVPVAITVAITVDGTPATSTSALLTGLNSYSGYWHLGWSPLSSESYGSGLSNYFAGSLSNFVVFNTSPAPTSPTNTQDVDESAFTAWAAPATEQWPLNDDGTTTTYAGPYPIGGSPCAMVDLDWEFSTPTACAWSPPSTTQPCTAPPASSIADLVTAGWQSVAAPGPGATQSATLTVTRDVTYNTYISGLHLYLPLSVRIFTQPAGAWVATFTWTDPTVMIMA